MRTLGDGMGGMTHENDIRIAEGLQTITLPSDPAQALAGWRGALNDAVVGWHRARGSDMPDLNDLVRRGITEAIGFAFPHHFILPTIQQRVVVPDPSARAGGDAVRDLVVDPDARRPIRGKAHPAAAAATRRSKLAADPGSGLLQPAAAAKRVAFQGV